MPKDDLKDRLDGKELDLTLSNLTTVPVKELAALPKATHLDLSCNLLATLPDPFCTLRHLVKIDLSKNVLIELPVNFGDLENLQHLDLLGNKLTLLPVSFCHLTKLRWLDLKDNPLESGLKNCAGDCLDEAQCRLCAKQVVAYMTAIDAELEKKRQQKLEAEKKRLAKKVLQEEGKKQRAKEKKKLEKERRRKEYEMQRNSERRAEADQEEEEESEKQSDNEKPVVNGPHLKQDTRIRKGSTGLGICGLFMVLVIGLLAVAVGLYYYCDMNHQIPTCQKAMNVYNNVLQQTRQKTDKFIIYIYETYTEIVK